MTAAFFLVVHEEGRAHAQLEPASLVPRPAIPLGAPTKAAVLLPDSAGLNRILAGCRACDGKHCGHRQENDKLLFHSTLLCLKSS
jgi:hypothetical protein